MIKEDVGEWCTEGIVKEHRIIRKIRGGSKTDSYLAVDSRGEKVVLTTFNIERMLERYRFKAHVEGAEIGDVDKEAMKLVECWLEEQKEMVQRIKGLGSDHVAVTYGLGAGLEENRLVIISEYVPGVDFYYATTGLKIIQMISLFVQALEGLKFIHKQGFLHLNVKPSRIRVDVEGVPFVVKLTDFGFAIPKEGYKGEYHGTALYMAPEVAMARREVIDERTDLYSFGIMTYYCLTARHPTEHRLDAIGDKHRLATFVERESVFSPPSHFNKETPKELDRIIMELLEKDPEKRPYHTAADLIAEFYKQWPEESAAMPHEETSTSFEL